MAHVSRRRFLAGGLAGTVTAGLASAAAGCGGATSGRADRPASDGGEPASAPRYLPFGGPHPTGITQPAAEQGLLAASTVTADNRDELGGHIAGAVHRVPTPHVRLSTESRRLMSGTPYEDRDPAYPPLHTGTVGNPPPPADLSVVVSVGGVAVR